MALLERYNWYHVAILYTASDTLLNLQGESLRHTLRDDPNYPMPYDYSYVPSNTTNHHEMLLRASQDARGKWRVCVTLKQMGNFISE